MDRVIIDSIARLSKYLLRNREKPALKWSEAIEAAVLMFSDQQLVTGIAILLSGYTQLNCALLTYHWIIVVYLAWFSSLTHLITLTALRSFFREQAALAYWRVLFMGCLAVLLAVGLGLTGHVFFFSPGLAAIIPMSVPALCLFSPSGTEEAISQDDSDANLYLRSFNWLYIFLALLFLTVSYFTRVSSLFPERARSQLRTRPVYWLKKQVIVASKKSGTSKRIISRMLWVALALVMMTVYVLSKAMHEIGTSMLWEVSLTTFP